MNPSVAAEEIAAQQSGFPIPMPILAAIAIVVIAVVAVVISNKRKK